MARQKFSYFGFLHFLLFVLHLRDIYIVKLQMKMSKNKSLHCTKVRQTGCDEGGRLGRRIDCLRSPITTAPFYSLYGLLERFGKKYETYLYIAKIWFLDINFHACKLIFKNNRHRLFRFNFNRIWIETIYNSRGFTEVFLTISYRLF